MKLSLLLSTGFMPVLFVHCDKILLVQNFKVWCHNNTKEVVVVLINGCFDSVSQLLFC